MRRDYDDELGSQDGAPGPIRDLVAVNSGRNKTKSVDFGKSGNVKSENTD